MVARTSFQYCNCYGLPGWICISVSICVFRTDEIRVSFVTENWLHFLCLPRRIVLKVCLLSERDWKAINEIDFAGRVLLGCKDFMRENQFWSLALRIAKATVDVERERLKKKGGADAVTCVVQHESWKLFLEFAWIYSRLFVMGCLCMVCGGQICWRDWPGMTVLSSSISPNSKWRRLLAIGSKNWVSTGVRSKFT